MLHQLKTERQLHRVLMIRSGEKSGFMEAPFLGKCTSVWMNILEFGGKLCLVFDMKTK